MHGHVLEGKYRVIEMLARGGMGIVYTGIHETTGRRLAIKFIHPEASTNKRAVKRFQNEARIAAMVRHRNIRTILDVGTTPDGVHYIVMEYLDGESLAEVIDREGTLPVPEALAITNQILSSLNAVHAKDIVHRDLKPDNVFLASETGGTRIVKVLDFGLSRLASAKETVPTRITRDGAVVGTPMYMAPEQARGTRLIDHRADLFSVGIILYRLLTGKQPFQARSYNHYLVTVTTTDPTPPSTLREELPAGLDDIMEKVLAKEPDDRYASAEEFTQALASMVASELPEAAAPLSADQPGETDPGSRSSTATPPSSTRSDIGEAKTVAVAPAPRRRELTWLLPTGVGLLLVVSGIAGFFAYRVMTTPAREGARESAPPAVVEKALPDAGDPVSWKVTLAGTPESASVYVDHVLHPERPVVVEGGKTAFGFRVTAPGFEPWEREVAVSSDLTLDVSMTPLGSSSTPAKKGGKKPKPRPTKGKIERTFPGMGN
jgi:serine/threonine-protein kinase